MVGLVPTIHLSPRMTARMICQSRNTRASSFLMEIQASALDVAFEAMRFHLKRSWSSPRRRQLYRAAVAPPRRLRARR